MRDLSQFLKIRPIRFFHQFVNIKRKPLKLIDYLIRKCYVGVKMSFQMAVVSHVFGLVVSEYECDCRNNNTCIIYYHIRIVRCHSHPSSMLPWVSRGSQPVIGGSFVQLLLWELGIFPLYACDSVEKKHTSYIFFFTFWLWRLSFLRCRTRDPLPGLNVLQPDHSGASWLEDVWWNEEPGQPKIRAGDDWGSPAQSNPWTGLCSVVDCFIASQQAERIRSAYINYFYPLLFLLSIKNAYLLEYSGYSYSEEGEQVFWKWNTLGRGYLDQGA